MLANPRQKRVAFVIAHLGSGGAQRVLTNAANAFVERGLDVHVVTILDDHPDAFDLDPRIRRHQKKRLDGAVRRAARPIVRAASALGRPTLTLTALGTELILLRWLRKTIREIRPDAVISFLTQTNVLTVLATRGLRTRTVISERNDPRRQRHRRRVELVRRLVYRWADLVTANTYGALEALEVFVPRRKLAFLPNPLAPSHIKPDRRFPEPTFITVTRLVEQKGLDVLIRASAKALVVLPGWRLAIVGDGPLRMELQGLAQELQIADRVMWLGHVADPTAYLKAAKFFVLTSRFEGSPNALLEAMACGLPAIASDASPGPLELIGDEEAGLIVPVGDVDLTARAIERLANDESLRTRLGSAALERSHMHHLDRAIPLWLELLDCA